MKMRLTWKEAEDRFRDTPEYHDALNDYIRRKQIEIIEVAA